MSLNFEIWKGTDVTLRIQVFERNNITPQNMSGWALAFSVRNRAEDADVDISKTTGAGITIVNGDPTTYPDEEITGSNSVASVTIADSDTDGLSGIYECDLKRTNDGQEGVLAFGRITIKRGVSA